MMKREYTKNMLTVLFSGVVSVALAQMDERGTHPYSPSFPPGEDDPVASIDLYVLYALTIAVVVALYVVRKKNRVK